MGKVLILDLEVDHLAHHQDAGEHPHSAAHQHDVTGAGAVLLVGTDDEERSFSALLVVVADTTIHVDVDVNVDVDGST